LARRQGQLPDEYTVFHGVHWTRQYQGTTLYGESDFVVLNPAGRVLFIEQKNGSLRETKEGLFKALERVGNRPLARFNGECDFFGNQVWTSGQILFDRVSRFKGQQQAAVVLTDVDPQEKPLAQELPVLFCGITRATVRLDVVCNERNPWVAEHLIPTTG